MATILITGAGGGHVGIGVVEWLKKTTQHELIGVDSRREAGGLYDCQFSYEIPAADDDEWTRAIVKIIDKHQVDVVIPTFDDSLSKLSDVRDLSETQVEFIAAREEILSMVYDKYRSAKELADLGIAVPESVRGNQLDKLDPEEYPAVVKPRTGQGNSLGSGVEIVETPGEARAEFDARSESARELVVQEYIDGKEYTTSVLGTKQNDLLAVVPKEAVTSNPYHRVTREAPVVKKTCRKMFELLQPEGILNIQHVVKDGTAYTIEINPRFSSSSCLTAAAGINGYKLLVRDALGEDVEHNAGFEADRHLLRTPKNVYVDQLSPSWSNNS